MQPAEDLPTKTSLILSTRHYPVCDLWCLFVLPFFLRSGLVVSPSGTRASGSIKGGRASRKETVRMSMADRLIAASL
jgi:hypothetical protein